MKPSAPRAARSEDVPAYLDPRGEPTVERRVIDALDDGTIRARAGDLSGATASTGQQRVHQPAMRQGLPAPAPSQPGGRELRRAVPASQHALIEADTAFSGMLTSTSREL